MSRSLSIIVPVYNTEKYLSKCLESLINQDYDNYKIILIDDGSTDGSKKICKSFEKNHPNLIKVYSKKNGGQASARNYAIKKVDTDYIFFVDSDDYIKENCLKELMKKLGNKDILVFNQISVLGEEETIVNTFDKSIIDVQKRYLVSNPGPCNKIIKSSLLKENKLYFPENIIYEDLAMIPQLGLWTKNIAFEDDAYYYYIQRIGSTMHQKKYNPKIENIFSAIEILEQNFNGLYSDELEYIYIWHLLKNGSLRFLDFDKFEMVDKVIDIIKNKFSLWYKNCYFKKFDIKKKIMCYLIALKAYKLVKLLRGGK